MGKDAKSKGKVDMGSRLGALWNVAGAVVVAILASGGSEKWDCLKGYGEYG